MITDYWVPSVASPYQILPANGLIEARGSIPGKTPSEKVELFVDNVNYPAGLGLIPGSKPRQGNFISVEYPESGEAPAGIFEDISKFAKGGAIVLGGVAVGYLSKYIPKPYKTAGYVGATGLGAYGLWTIYKAFKKEEPIKPPPDLQFPIVITDPYDGERWSTLLPHNVNVEVNNPYNQTFKLFVGMSMIHTETGEVFDFPIKSFTIEPTEVKKLSWYVYGSPQGPGWYRVISSVWDVLPTGDCEAEGTCNRLGTAESNVEFRIIG